MFRQKVGEYSSEMAMRMEMDPKTSPCKSYSVRHCCFLYSNILLTYSVAHAASWWMMLGSSTPKLQYLTMSLVSQCCSSSGAGGAASGSGGARGVHFTCIHCIYKCTHISDYEY